MTKRGMFVIGSAMLKDEPDTVKYIMGHMIVYRAEYLYASKRNGTSCIEYCAESDLFDSVNHGGQIPFYEIYCDGQGILAKRIKDEGHNET